MRKNITQKTEYGYSYLIYDKALNDVPLEVAFMEHVDETGTGLGIYYSFASMHSELGDKFKPIPYINSGMLLVHLPFALGVNGSGDDDVKELSKEIKKLSGKDFRQGVKYVEDIDFSLIAPDSFGFFDAYEITLVPKSV